MGVSVFTGKERHCGVTWGYLNLAEVGVKKSF